MPVLVFRLDASVAEVYRLLTDHQFLVERRAAAGDTDIDVRLDQVGAALKMRIECTIAPDMPAFARKLFARWIKIIETSEWRPIDGGYQQTIHTDVAGGAGAVTGTTTLRAVGGGCEIREEFDGTVYFPVFKKRLLSVLIRETEKAIHADYEYLLRGIDHAHVAIAVSE